MNWWPFGKEQVTLDAPHALLADVETRGKRYLDDVDNGKFISPACKRTASDAGGDEASVRDHTALEAFRYLLMVPRNEFRLLAEPEQQEALLDGYLRQLPHEEIVIDFTGNTNADLAIAIIAGFNWLLHCAVPRRRRPETVLRCAAQFSANCLLGPKVVGHRWRQGALCRGDPGR